MLLGKSIKNDCNNLYLHKNPFKITVKLNSYMAPIFCHGPINPSTLNSRKMNLKQWQIFLLLKKPLKNGCNHLYLPPNTFNMSLRSFSYLVSISWGGPVNPSTSTFPNINLTKTIKYLLTVWKITEQEHFFQWSFKQQINL